MVHLTASLLMPLLHLILNPEHLLHELPGLHHPPLPTPHPNTTHTAHHPLPNQPTLSSPLLTQKPQSTQRRPLPTPRASPQSTPRPHHHPTLRPHHQPTHRILTPSNHSNILSHSMITTASNLPMDHTSPAMELHHPTTLPRHLTTLPRHLTTLPRHLTILPRRPTTPRRHLTTPPRLLPTSTQHSRSTSSLPTASYPAMGDTKEDMATLPKHLTILPRRLTTLSQPMASQPRTEPHLQPTLRNHPILRNQPTLSSQHILRICWLNRHP